MTGSVHPEPPQRRIDPPSLAKPLGYAHGVLAAPGRTLYLAGQVGWDAKGQFPIPDGLVAQTEKALSNLIEVLAAAGGKPEHVTSMRIYVLSADAWRAHSKALGDAWRRTMGRWFPAMALLEVRRLYEPQAQVEIEATAVIPSP